MKTLIVGRGEIGQSLYSILKDYYPVWCEDIKPELRKMDNCPKDGIDILHVCIRYSEDFNGIVYDYIQKYLPDIVNVCSTVPPGTCHGIFPFVCHSTSRGLHPNLAEGMETIVKHIGGPNPQRNRLKEYFEWAGIRCVEHEKARTTELLHILNNVHYGVNLMFADEAYKLCREYGVDYYDYMRYTQTNNEGYVKMGHPTKVRPILTPPNNNIGGHCVIQSAQLLPEDKRPPMINRLASWKNK